MDLQERVEAIERWIKAHDAPKEIKEKVYYEEIPKCLLTTDKLSAREKKFLVQCLRWTPRKWHGIPNRCIRRPAKDALGPSYGNIKNYQTLAIERGLLVKCKDGYWISLASIPKPRMILQHCPNMAIAAANRNHWLGGFWKIKRDELDKMFDKSPSEFLCGLAKEFSVNPLVFGVSRWSILRFVRGNDPGVIPLHLQSHFLALLPQRGKPTVKGERKTAPASSPPGTILPEDIQRML